MNDLQLTAPISSIKRFAVHDGDGIRTTVFLKGCPLRCRWCHNPEGLSAKPELAYREERCLSCGLCVAACPAGAHRIENGRHAFDRASCIGCGACEEACPGGVLTFYGKKQTVEELIPILLEDRDFFETSGGGVTVSGGECLLHPHFTLALAKALHREGIRVDIDTSGFAEYGIIRELIPYTECFLYDIKAIDSALHRSLTGQPNEQILENLGRLLSDGGRAEIRYPYVPGCNDGEASAIAEYLAPLPIVGIRVLPYHSFAGSKYENLGLSHALPPTLPTSEEMERVRDLFRAKGIRVIV